jgi:hypothetical protein
VNPLENFNESFSSAPKKRDEIDKIFGNRNIKKQNQLDQRGNTFWEPIELVERPYSPVDFSSTYFFGIFS